MKGEELGIKSLELQYGAEEVPARPNKESVGRICPLEESP